MKRVDLSGERCPLTFIRAMEHLEQIQEGDLIEFTLLAGEQSQQIPQSLKEEGHQIEKVATKGELIGLTVRKGSRS